MTLISVIIPTYNRSCLVKEAIESVLHQNYKDIEVLVIDDGSTDNTSYIVRNISDSRVRYIYKNNGGAASAVNLGLANAQGEYVAFLESDDAWPEDFLSIMLSSLKDNPDFGGAYSLFRNRHPDGKEVVAFEKDRYMSGWLTEQFFKRPPFIIPSATFFHRSVWENFSWDEVLRSQCDIDTFLRISTRSKFLCVPKTCIIRKLTADSLTLETQGNIFPNAALIYERFYFNFGGDKIVPGRVASRWFNRLYRGIAKAHCNRGNRAAAIWLFKKAISYYPFNRNDYLGLLKAWRLDRKNDGLPDWELPETLPPYITREENKIEWKVRS